MVAKPQLNMRAFPNLRHLAITPIANSERHRYSSSCAELVNAQNLVSLSMRQTMPVLHTPLTSLRDLHVTSCGTLNDGYDHGSLLRALLQTPALETLSLVFYHPPDFMAGTSEPFQPSDLPVKLPSLCSAMVVCPKDDNHNATNAIWSYLDILVNTAIKIEHKTMMTSLEKTINAVACQLNCVSLDCIKFSVLHE